MSRITYLFLFVFLGVSTASAQPDEIFTVPMVSVFAEGENASAAQSKAQARGRRQAMDLLLRRLTAEQDWVYLPNLAAGQPAQAPASIPEIPSFDTDNFGTISAIQSKSPIDISSVDVVAMEQGFAIFEEKTSPSSYRAKITYRFKPEAVRGLLQQAGLPYSEAQARRALIIPVLETAENKYLWESKNPWARAWLARPLLNELTPLILPIGDRQDVETITANEADGLEVDQLGELARRYRVEQVLVAQGTLQQVDGEYRLLVRLIDGYFTDRNDINAAANAAARRYDSEDGFGSSAIATRGAGRRGQVVVEAFFRGSDDDFPALAQRAVETTVARYAKDWKAKTLVDHSSMRQLRLTAWFVGLEEWGNIQRALEGTSLVRNMKVGAMNKENAVIDLQLIGDDDQLLLEMRQSNLTVWRAADGSWNIADNARASKLQLELNDVALSLKEMDRINRPELNRPGRPLGSEMVGPGETSDPFAPVALDREPGVVTDGSSNAPVELEPVEVPPSEDE